MATYREITSVQSKSFIEKSLNFRESRTTRNVLIVLSPKSADESKRRRDGDSKRKIQVCADISRAGPKAKARAGLWVRMRSIS